MTTIRPIHPFPARMAPDIALDVLQNLPTHTTVLDPMMGSGTVLKAAIDIGLHAIGRDVDPLAVLMSRVWTTSIDTRKLREYAIQLVGDANHIRIDSLSLPWIDSDPETSTFIDFWFGGVQKGDLRKLCFLIREVDGPEGEALRLALSRIIITKDNGASLARDVSHSRPHRVIRENSFSVMDGFLKSVAYIARQFDGYSPRSQADVSQEDARALTSIANASIDTVITSPPYLNAINYLRGHRLALVWLGYRLSELQAIRSGSIGIERAPDPHQDICLADVIVDQLELRNMLPQRELRMIKRYVLDSAALLSEIHRVLRAGGTAVFVVGNTCLHGVFVKNAKIFSLLAERAGFEIAEEREREIPPNRRYLPPPHISEHTDLKNRMRTETVLTFVHA